MILIFFFFNLKKSARNIDVTYSVLTLLMFLRLYIILRTFLHFYPFFAERHSFSQRKDFSFNWTFIMRVNISFCFCFCYFCFVSCLFFTFWDLFALVCLFLFCSFCLFLFDDWTNLKKKILQGMLGVAFIINDGICLDGSYVNLRVWTLPCRTCCTTSQIQYVSWCFVVYHHYRSDRYECWTV